MLRILVPLMCVKYTFFGFSSICSVYLICISSLMMNKIVLICKCFFQNPQSLIYVEFCEYLLWVQAMIEVNSLAVLSKRVYYSTK